MCERKSFPKTITTCLINGDPLGIKTVEILWWVGKCIVIPRAQLHEAKQREEVKRPSLYFLFGENEAGDQLCYIGQTAELFKRIIKHSNEKDFWNVLVAFVSRDDAYDTRYLEEKAISLKKEAKIYGFDQVSPTPILLSEAQKAPMDEFLRNTELLLSSLWYPVFQKKEHTMQWLNREIVYSFKDNNLQRWSPTDARGIYSSGWFLVHKWSKWPIQLQDHVISNNGYASRHRPRLLELWVIKEEWDAIVFQIDYWFGSPSSAIQLITWASVNGWIYRKDDQWKTLTENERKELE